MLPGPALPSTPQRPSGHSQAPRLCAQICAGEKRAGVTLGARLATLLRKRGNLLYQTRADASWTDYHGACHLSAQARAVPQMV